MDNNFLDAKLPPKEKTNWQIKIYPAVFAVYGIVLSLQLISAWITGFHDVNSVKKFYDVLNNVILLFYIPAVILDFCRVKTYIFFLVLAYAYDLWFHFWSSFEFSSDNLFTDHPFLLLYFLLTVLIGIFYPGFRVKFKRIYEIIKEKRQKRNE